MGGRARLVSRHKSQHASSIAVASLSADSGDESGVLQPRLSAMFNYLEQCKISHQVFTVCRLIPGLASAYHPSWVCTGPTSPPPPSHRPLGSLDHRHAPPLPRAGVARQRRPSSRPSSLPLASPRPSAHPFPFPRVIPPFTCFPPVFVRPGAGGLWRWWPLPASAAPAARWGSYPPPPPAGRWPWWAATVAQRGCAGFPRGRPRATGGQPLAPAASAGSPLYPP